MKKIIAKTIFAAAVALPALIAPSRADDAKITKGYHTMDAMGCMLVRECTDGVKKSLVFWTSLVSILIYDDFTFVAHEFNSMLVSLNSVGVGVFLAPERYFPHTHRGVYHTVGNNFFLNRKFMGNPGVLMQVMRHEGWHAAQDCMSRFSIGNSIIAIIKPEEDAYGLACHGRTYLS